MMKNVMFKLGLLAFSAFAYSQANATTYYISDCQSGAASGCVAGNDSNSGTSPSTPWRSTGKLASAFNAGKPGDQFLLAKGGAWVGAAMILYNNNAGNPSAMFANPMIVDSYTPSWGGSAKPVLTAGSGQNTFDFYKGAEPAVSGGYIVRNLSLQGAGVADVGIRFINGVSNVVIENMTVNGYNAGTTCGGTATAGSDPSYITVRNSTFTNNRGVGVGMWGCPNIVVDSNTLDNNGFTRPMMDHSMYISGSDRGRTTANVVIRNNKLTNNSLTSGTCQASAMVGHDVAADWLIENNYIYQAPGTAGAGCWGIQMSPGNGGYTEGMDRLVIRGNTIVNMGNVGVEIAACRTCTIENNVLVWTMATSADAIRFRAPYTSPAYVGTALTVRNNSIYFANTNDTSTGIVVNDQGTGHVIVSNLISFASGIGARCLDTNLAGSAFTAWDNNLCSGGSWSGKYSTRATLTSALGFDANSLSVDPKLLAVPSQTNGFSMALTSTSPAINTGNATRSSSIDRLGITRSTPDIGAYEYTSAAASTPPAPPQNVTVK